MYGVLIPNPTILVHIVMQMHSDKFDCMVLKLIAACCTVLDCLPTALPIVIDSVLTAVAALLLLSFTPFTVLCHYCNPADAM
jgi:hypothetical protein